MRPSLPTAALLLGVTAGVLGPSFTPPGWDQPPAVAFASDAHAVAGNVVLRRPGVLYERPSFDSRVLRRLSAGTTIHVVDSKGDWYRVRATRPGRPDGYVHRSSVDASRAFRPGLFRLTRRTAVHASPSTASPRITHLRSGAEVRVVALQGRWYRIESITGRRPPAYIDAGAARRVRDL